MVRPSTYWPPIIFMACITAARITGSPRVAVRRFTQLSVCWVISASRLTSWPVSIRLQVEALTNNDSDLPLWAPQLPPRIFSAIRRSAVRASGTRSRASARHIRATPSALERPNSSRKASKVPLLCLSARQSVTSCRALLSICSLVLLDRGLLCSSWVTAWCSSWWVVARILWRSSAWFIMLAIFKINEYLALLAISCHICLHY